MEMRGIIPDSIYHLKNLKALHLRNNEPGFWGTAIKSDIKNLINLEELILNDNPLLEGTVPPELGLCKNICKFLFEFSQQCFSRA